MTAIVVVTRNPAIAIGLQRHGYDVSDVRPDRYGEWTRELAVAAVVVLELSDPLAAESAVQRLRSEGNGVPVLLVSNDSPGWDTTALHTGPGTRVFPLPISLPALLAALEDLVTAGPIVVPADYVPPVRPAEPAPEAPDPAPETDDLPYETALPVDDAPGAAFDAPLADPAPDSVALPGDVPLSLVDAPAEAPGGEALFSEVAASIGLTVTQSGALVTDPAALPAVVPVGHPGSPDEAAAAADPDPEPLPVPDPDPVPLPEPAPVPVPSPEPVPVPEPAPRPGHTGSRPPGPRSELDALAAALVARVREFNTVPDCAEVAADELADRVGAEATACLVRDGDEWRVAGGRALRPLETRLRLGADHWLVQAVAGEGRALLVDDTDAAREALHGAPLASWRRLLAVPLPGVGGVLVAARNGEPFDERLLAAAAGVAREAAPLLVEAVAARTLARALLPFADPVD